MVTSDVVLGLRLGDEGKGKVAYNLSRDPKYTHIVRYQGGPNAGHTEFHWGEKFVTHMIPVGVFHNKPSVIGPGCVFHKQSLFDEIIDLERRGINVLKNLKVAYNAHIITDEHLAADSTENVIGTTRKGIGPTYVAKYARSGVRAEDDRDLQELLVDCIDYLNKDENHLLFEGAQGFELDIDYGDYPYVTSSTTSVAGVLSAGVPPQSINKVFGVAKGYDTYSGFKNFQPANDSDLEFLQKAGEEFGATTGRKRQVNWLNWDRLMQACRVNGVTDLIINKLDIFEQIKKPKMIVNGELRTFDDHMTWRIWVSCNTPNINVKMSSNPITI